MLISLRYLSLLLVSKVLLRDGATSSEGEFLFSFSKYLAVGLFLIVSR